MTDKVQKIREEVEKLKSQLLRGACSSQIAMETMCKEEAYNEVLAILDTMQEEPKQCMYSKDNYTEEDRKVLCEGCEEKCKFNQVKESAILQHKEEMCKENGDSLTQEPVSEDLGEYINELSKQFPEVSFAKLSRIAVRVAKWQKEQLMTNGVDGVVHHFEKCGVASVHYNDPTGVPMAYFTSPEGLSAGDKVKIIVIKED